MNKMTTILLCTIFVSLATLNMFAQVPNITKDPEWQGVVAGQTATFQVTATGSGLAYQWYKNGTLIPLATNSSYTTPVTVLADNNSIFSVKVTNISGSDSSNGAKLFVTAIGNRVTENLQLLYNFNEASGTTVNDNSGVGTPYNLGIDNPSTITWTPKGLGINDVAYINANQSATKVINAAESTNELTLEAWLVPAILNQRDGARILTLSADNSHSNFSIIQINGKYYFRLRTTTTDTKGEPSLSTSSSTSLNLSHIVYTRSQDGTTKVYINGVLDASGSVSGNLSNWDSSFRLALANEFGDDRPWLGTYYLLSVYNRALSQAEVQENYTVGVTTDHKPKIIIEPQNLGLIAHQQATFSVSAVGDAPLTYQWRKNGVNITDADSSSYTLPTNVFIGNNGEEYSVIVNNGSGADTSRNAILYVTGSSPRVTEGQFLFYNFQGGSGDSIVDSANFGAPLNLKINNINAVTWKPYGLIVNSNANILSTSDVTKITNNVQEYGEFTFEAWVKPNSSQQSPAAILSIANSTDPTKRDFAVFQEADALNSRLRTSTTDNSGSSLSTPGGILNKGLFHIVYVHNTKEVSKIYINGVEVTSGPWFTGNFDTWKSDYLLQIGSEFSLNHTWIGLFNLISFYNRALDSVEIVHNYEIGPMGVSLKSPGILTAQVPHSGMVSLAWKDSSNNEDGFIIERQTLGPIVQSYVAIDTVISNDTTYNDLNVTDTTSYKYRIKAYNILASSAYSNEVTIKTLLSTIPAPTNLTAIKDNSDTVNVKLSWKDNSSNELGFIIQRKLGDSTSIAAYSNIDSVAANVIAYVDTTTHDTTKYTYRIYAYNADTVSAFSNVQTYTTPVPVELTSFSADVVNGKILLSWQTATEINNSGFSIERSKDSKKFSEVAFIKGKGTSTDKSFYSYTDKSVLSGKYYYRLKQINFDGTYSYLKSLEIDLGVPKSYALDQNYPNPFNPSTTIKFAVPVNAKVNIKLFNTLGQEVANLINSDLNAGVYEKSFNASNLSSGVYFYRLEAHGVDGSNYISTKRMLLMK